MKINSLIVPAVLFSLPAFAQDTNAVAPADAVPQVATGLTDTILKLATEHPAIATVLLVIGTLRLCLKPLMTVARLVVASTASKEDDALLDKVEHSWLWTGVLFALDWLTSIKLPAKSPSATVNKALRLLLLSAFSISALSLTGCAGRSTASVVRALAKDPASVHVRITTIYGTIEVARTAPRTNSMPHTIGENGAITVKP